MGMKWSCSGSRFLDETKVYAEPGMTDVHQFLQDSSLAPEEDAEMEAVSDTFPGVENLNGLFRWEGRHYEQMLVPKHVEDYGMGHSYQTQLVVKYFEPGWARLGEPQRKRLLSSLWKILPHRTSTIHSVELIEFASDLGNANNCTLPSSSGLPST